jgi:tetrapyrrole (corrin/porphyrin) methylase-like protein
VSRAAPSRGGSLAVVGTGIRPGLHLTQESRSRIEQADDVLYLLAEVAPTGWIRRLNPAAESLLPIYRLGRDRDEVYEEIVETVLARARAGRDVCMVTYGHPSVFDDSSHEAVRRALAEGFSARVFPAVSAIDCLFVDLGVDPGGRGLQLYDATDFLVSERTPDVAVPLVLWQISVIGQLRTTGSVHRPGLRDLAERLGELYGPDHKAVVYEASPFPAGRPQVERTAVKDLPDAGVTGLSTLYVPPVAGPSTDRRRARSLASSTSVSL